MRKVNIMVDVSEEVYDTVVVPFKKSRKFSELINSLLTGYLKDNYVASYVEGTLDTLKNESARSLDEAIESMNQSFAMVGMLTDEASDMMSNGIDAVRVREREKGVVGQKERISSESSKEDNKENVKEGLLKEIDELKKQNNEMGRSLRKVLKALNMDFDEVTAEVDDDTSVPAKEEASATVESKSVSEVPNEDMQSKEVPERSYTPEVHKESENPVVEVVEQHSKDKDDAYDPLGDDITFGDEDISDAIFEDEEPDDDEDEDFLSGLLQGQVMSV